jgi:antiviral helicase SKI2
VFEIAEVDAQRSTRDLLPYLPRFRPMFSPLPDRAARVKSGTTQVQLDDVECVTQTVVKVRGPNWYLKIARGNTYIISRSTCGRC